MTTESHSLGELLPEVNEGFQAADPGSNEAIQKVLDSVGGDWPSPEGLESDLVTLPGGLKLSDGTLITTAQVRELTGADEEAIARASISMNPFHFINTLLERGVVQVGDQPKKKTRELLKRLLVGDRDALIMGIRNATYGDEIEVTNLNGDDWICPECETSSQLTIQLEDIPVREHQGAPGEHEFEVELRKGRVAKLSLATGADQLAVFENIKLNLKERDTILLARTLISIKEANGQVNGTAGFAQGVASSMNMVDRAKILKELLSRQPGPQFSDIKFTHDVCNKEVTVAVGIGDMFPHL
jgi:hypothetical protein